MAIASKIFSLHNSRSGGLETLTIVKFFLGFLVICSLTFTDVAAEGQDSDTSDKATQWWVSDKGGTLAQNVVGGFGDFMLKFKDTWDLGMDFEEKFDDNIYDTWEVKRVHDFITVLEPKATITIDRAFFNGILTGSNSAKSDITQVPIIRLSLDSRIEYYVRNPKLNGSTEPISYLQPKVAVEVRPEDNLLLHFLLDRSRIEISNLDPLKRGKDRKKLNQTTVRYGLNYTFGAARYPIHISYEHTDTDNGKGESDSNQLQNDWSLTFVPLPGTSRLAKLFFDYQGQGSDIAGVWKTTHEFFVGLKGNFSPKIKGTAKFGYGFTVPGDNLFDFSRSTGDMVASLDWKYTITPRSSVTLDVNSTVKNITSFSVDDDGGLNVPTQIKNSWGATVGFKYVPPFLMDNLTIGGAASQREINYGDGHVQKTREASLSYDYAWRNKDRTIDAVWRWSSKWKISGEIKTRLISPDIGWEKYMDNVASLKITMEF